MKILITGSKGQVAKELERILLEEKITYQSFDSKELDISSEAQLRHKVESWDPNIIINCAAYTNVEGAEVYKEKALNVNVIGVKNLVKICLEKDIVLIHISSDYVFDGRSLNHYSENSIPNPLNFYGATKLIGDMIISSMLSNYFIVRTSWVYGSSGNNFLRNIAKKIIKKESLQVVGDQIGSPTSSKSISQFIIFLCKCVKNRKFKNYGLYNFCNAGQITWYEFAKQIILTLKQKKIIESPIKLTKIRSSEIKSKARRPKRAVLSTDKASRLLNYKMRDWKDELIEAINELY